MIVIFALEATSYEIEKVIKLNAFHSSAIDGDG
jgi:hypothetical protein